MFFDVSLGVLQVLHNRNGGFRLAISDQACKLYTETVGGIFLNKSSRVCTAVYRKFASGSIFLNKENNNNTIHDRTVSPNVAPKKRKRIRIRKKIIPAIKTYKIPTETDVLMGRGGKSNHHSGNINYRAEISRTQEEYKTADCIQEKTSISEQLVRRIQAMGGNFLEKDGRGWYIIDDKVAREKVSQALRDDKDPEKRRAKRQRFLARRAMNH